MKERLKMTAEPDGNTDGKNTRIRECIQNLKKYRDGIAGTAVPGVSLKPVDNAIAMLEKIEEENTWRYVEKDGNPTEPGDYTVLLVYPDPDDKRKEDEARQLASIAYRRFAAGSRFAMYDQRKGRPVWTKNTEMEWLEDMCHGGWREKVHAWLPGRLEELPDLPDGVKWDECYW